MSENCHPGIEYLLQLYAEEQSRVDTALTQKVHHVTVQEGMKGDIMHLLCHTLSTAVGLDGDQCFVSVFHFGILCSCSWKETSGATV